VKRNEEINRAMKDDGKKVLATMKLLLLGAGESGKSTIAKQMKILHLNGFTKDEKQMYTIAIHQNIYGAVRSLVQACQRLQISIAESAIAKKFEEGALLGARITPAFADDIAKLWRDPGVQQAYGRRNEFQLIDSTAYWLDDVRRVAAEDFVPAEQDVLRARIQTTGIVEIQFSFKGHDFILVDVGGQRSERKKWIHCFQDVTSILFCTGISEFDQVLYEDNKTNRLHEAFNLFREICLSKWFLKSTIILFLNKSDILEAKLKAGKSLKVCYPDYGGGDTFEEVTKYIQKVFTSINNPITGKPREVFPFVTNATDTNNVQRVFDAVETSITTQAMKDAGIDTF